MPVSSKPAGLPFTSMRKNGNRCQGFSGFPANQDTHLLALPSDGVCRTIAAMKKKEEESGYDRFLVKVLTEQRKLAGLSQKEVEGKIKLSSSDLSRIENGKKAITEPLLFKLCGLYGTSVVTVANDAYERYQAHLLEKGPGRDEPVEPILPDHPFASQVVEIYDRYVQSRQENERELFLSILRYIEMVKPTP